MLRRTILITVSALCCAEVLIPDVKLLLSDYNIDYIESFLQVYEDYSFVVHTEEESSQTAEHLLRAISTNTTCISNYNTEYTNYWNLEKPPGNKFVHLILLRNPWKFQPFILKHKNILLYDVALFVVFDVEALKGDPKPFWHMENLGPAGRVLVFDVSRSEEVVVYGSCFYCGTLSKNLVEVEDGFSLDKVLPDNFDRLNGHLFRIGYMDFFPHMYCTKYEQIMIGQRPFRRCLIFGGGEAKMVQILATQLNFTFEFLYETSNAPALIMKNLVDKITDFAIGGISVTLQRSEIVNFTTTLRVEDYSVLYVFRHSFLEQFVLFAKPFQPSLWLLLCITFSAITLFIRQFILSEEAKSKMTVLQVYVLCVKSIIEQSEARIGTKLFKTRWAPFLVFFALLFACMEVNTAYKSKLASIFVRPPHTEPGSAEELIQAGYQISVDEQTLGFYSEMLSDTDPLLIFLKKKGVMVEGICKQVTYLTHHGASMMNELVVLQYYLRYVCPNQLFPKTPIPNYDPEKLRITSKPIRSNPHAWILQPAVPFWKAFDVVIGKLKNGGFLDKWTRDSLRDIDTFRTIPYSKNNFPEDYDTGLHTYSSSFLVYGIGNIIALMVFTGELIAVKLKKRKFEKLQSIMMKN